MDEAVAALWAATAAWGRGTGPPATRCGPATFAGHGRLALRSRSWLPRPPGRPPRDRADRGRRPPWWRLHSGRRDLAVRENEALWLRWAEAADAAAAASTSERKAAAIARSPPRSPRRNDRFSCWPGTGPGRRHSGRRCWRTRTPRQKYAWRACATSRRAGSGSRGRACDGARARSPALRRLAERPACRGLLMLTAGPHQALRAARQAIDARQSLAPGPRKRHWPAASWRQPDAGQPRANPRVITAGRRADALREQRRAVGRPGPARIWRPAPVRRIPAGPPGNAS